MSRNEQIEVPVVELEKLADSLAWRAFVDDIDTHREVLAEQIEGGFKSINGVQIAYSDAETWFLRGQLKSHRDILSWLTNAKLGETERLISDVNRADD